MQQIVMLLSRDFILLVILAFVISLPIAWFAAHEWLSGFSYRTTLSAWMFVLTAMTAILVAFLTVSFQTVRAANANPVESLRNE